MLPSMLSFSNYTHTQLKNKKMAGALKHYGSKQTNNNLISYLVVGTSDLCEKVSLTLISAAREKNFKIQVHKCEFVTEILDLKIELEVDFIIFVIDGQVSHSIVEVEKNINSVDESYIICGHCCIVFCYSSAGISMSIDSKSRLVANKYSIRRYLSVNTSDESNCQLLGKRLLNLSEGILGFRTGYPMIDYPLLF